MQNNDNGKKGLRAQLQRIPNSLERLPFLGSSMPCKVCSNLRGDLFASTRPAIAFDLVKEAASSGCHTCKLLMKGIVHSVPWVHQASSVMLRNHQSDFEWLGCRSLRIMVTGNPGHSHRLSGKVEFFTLEGCPSPWPIIGRAEIPLNNSSLKVELEQAKRWIDICEANHSKCQGDQVPYMPRRVVQILDSGNPPRIRLLESEPPTEVQRYVCLSHCWGKEPPLMTTIKSYQEFKHDIPWQKLLKTFQDAITVTSLLGIKYIWIDSLCILQDSKEDWAEESSKMCQIYGGSFLTIFATKAPNGTEGLFSRLGPQEMPKRIKGIDPKSRSRYSVYARSTFPHFYRPHEHREDKPKFPLLTRAWVYQERLMSRRVLHFGPGELSWECESAVTCECGGPQSADYVERYSKTSVSCLQGWKFPEVSGEWRGMVHEYSRLELTYSSDRLPALEGLANSMQQHRQDCYVAGIWEDSMIPDLCWYTSSTILSKRLNDVPTWSWASVSSTVSFPFYNGAQVLVRGFTYPSGDFKAMTTEVRKKLELKGPLVETTFVSTDHASGHLVPNQSVFTACIDELFEPSGTWYYPDVHLEANDDARSTSAFCLDMLSMYLKWSHRICHIYLVLRPLRGGSCNEFERVGLLEVWFSTEDEDGDCLSRMATQRTITIY